MLGTANTSVNLHCRSDRNNIVISLFHNGSHFSVPINSTFSCCFPIRQRNMTGNPVLKMFSPYMIMILLKFKLCFGGSAFLKCHHQYQPVVRFILGLTLRSAYPVLLFVTDVWRKIPACSTKCV